MPDLQTLLLFLVPALLVAITPGPGIFYVAARTLAGGRSGGLASSFGTGIGGLVHVIAGAVGVSALIMASAEAFTLLKIVGAFYLIWLGFKTWREAGIVDPIGVEMTGVGRAFREGILVEALKPQDGRILSRLHSAIRGPDRQRSPAVRHPRGHFGCAQHWSRCGGDLLGRESESRPGEATVPHSQDATDVGCSHVRAGSFPAPCAAHRLIA
jgi:hypothetical protein